MSFNDAVVTSTAVLFVAILVAKYVQVGREQGKRLAEEH